MALQGLPPAFHKNWGSEIRGERFGHALKQYDVQLQGDEIILNGKAISHLPSDPTSRAIYKKIFTSLSRTLPNNLVKAPSFSYKRWFRTILFPFYKNLVDCLIKETGMSSKIDTISIENFSDTLQVINEAIGKLSTMKKPMAALAYQCATGDIGTQNFAAEHNIPNQRQVFAVNDRKGNKREISLARHPSPTIGLTKLQTLFNAAVGRFAIPYEDKIAADYKSALNKPKTRVLYNCYQRNEASDLQTKASRCDHKRTKPIQALQDAYPIDVSVLSVEGDFFNKKRPSLTFASLFDDIINEFDKDNPARTCELPKKLSMNRAEIKAYFMPILKGIHQTCFACKKGVISKEERQAFIMLFYALLTFSMMFKLEGVTDVVNACKDNLDRGGAANLVMSFIVHLLQHIETGKVDKEALQKEIVNTLGPAFAIKTKHMLFDRLSPALEAIKQLAQMMQEKRGLKFKSFFENVITAKKYTGIKTFIPQEKDQPLIAAPKSAFTPLEALLGLRALKADMRAEKQPIESKVATQSRQKAPKNSAPSFFLERLCKKGVEKTKGKEIMRAIKQYERMAPFMELKDSIVGEEKRFMLRRDRKNISFSVKADQVTVCIPYNVQTGEKIKKDSPFYIGNAAYSHIRSTISYDLKEKTATGQLEMNAILSAAQWKRKRHETIKHL